MLASLPALLAATLLALLPCPAISRASQPLSPADYILYDIRDLMGVFQAPNTEASLHPLPPPPPPPPRSSSSSSSSSQHVLTVPLLRFPLPGRSDQNVGPLSSDLPIVFPIPAEDSRSSARRAEAESKLSDEASSGYRVVGYAAGPLKRAGASLCHLWGFPMGGGCVPGQRLLDVPETRSAGARTQRKSAPSPYLFGGAIGR